ncbi:hypothetical protein EGW08_018304, partial [Elysia chlorotica]
HLSKEGEGGLEAQVKSLSSQLHYLDENISCHESGSLTSPRDLESNHQVPMRKHHLAHAQDILRHSLNPSCLSSGLDGSLRDSVFLEEDQDDDDSIERRLGSPDCSEDYSVTGTGTSRTVIGSSGESGKKENRTKDSPVPGTSKNSSGFKFSVQKLAHRTFSKATNWNWASKKASSSSTSTTSSVSSPRVIKDGYYNDNNNTIGSFKEDTRMSREIATCFPAPDVIDMTTRAEMRLNMAAVNSELIRQSSLDDSAIRNIPENFQDSCAEGESHARIYHQPHRNPKEKILSKMASSSSMSGIGRFEGRLQNFSSSSPDLARDTSYPHSYHDSGSQYGETRDHSWSKSNQSLQQTWRPSSLALPTSASYGHLGSTTVTSPGGAATFEPSPRGSEGKALTPRREVNPDALAQIEAFEELSLRYLGATAK